MTPYAEFPDAVIYCGDCRDVLGALGQRFDAMVTDPPYGETSLDWDRQVSGWMDAAGQATSNIWCFGSLRMFMDMARSGECSGWRHGQEIVWEKQNGSAFHADRFKRVHELVVQFYRGGWADIYKSPVTTPDATARTVRRKRRPPHTGHIDQSAYVSHDGGPRLMTSVIYAANCHGYADHPTQKPTAVIAPLLRYSVPLRGAVIDPFMGSGSTLVTARNLGIRSVGIDVDERNCAIAARRLSQDSLPFQEPIPA